MFDEERTIYNLILFPKIPRPHTQRRYMITKNFINQYWKHSTVDIKRLAAIWLAVLFAYGQYGDFRAFFYYVGC